MKTVSLKQLRAKFPMVRKLIEQDGEVILAERGRPVFVISEHPDRQPHKAVRSHKLVGFDYFARLIKNNPKSISAKASQAIDEMNRKERC